jgi:hypothetical protein
MKATVADITAANALRMPRFAFIALYLVAMTKRKEYRGRLGLRVTHARGIYKVLSPIGGGTVTYQTSDPDRLFDYVRRGELGVLTREADEFRGIAYELGRAS